MFSFIVQLLSHIWFFETPWPVAHQASLSFSISCPLSWWRHPTISFSVAPFSPCPQSFPESGIFFPVSQLFTLGGQSIGASVSVLVLPMNIQSWFSLGSNQSSFLAEIKKQTNLKHLPSSDIYEARFEQSFHLYYKQQPHASLDIINGYWHSQRQQEVWEPEGISRICTLSRGPLLLSPLTCGKAGPMLLPEL